MEKYFVNIYSFFFSIYMTISLNTGIIGLHPHFSCQPCGFAGMPHIRSEWLFKPVNRLFSAVFGLVESNFISSICRDFFIFLRSASVSQF